MKHTTAILLAASLLLLTSCDQLRQTGATRAVPVVPQGSIHNGNRYTATWGDPEVVNWVDNVNGHRWTCTYQEFFKYCGGKHPSALSITVHGKLPANLTNPATAAPAQPATLAGSPTISNEPPAGEPVPYAVPQ